MLSILGLLNKQLCTHAKKGSQLLGMSFADCPFAAYYFRSNSFRPKNSSQVFLGKASGLYQVMQYLYRSSLTDRISALFELFNEHCEKFRQFFFLRRQIVALIQFHQLCCEPLIFLSVVDHTSQDPTNQPAISFLVD